MAKYLAYDACNNEYQEFETIEEAREWLEEGFLDPDEGYNLDDIKDFKIYILHETVDYDVVDKKSNYKYENEDDAPEGEEDEVWPHDNKFDEVVKHRFVPVTTMNNETFCQLYSQYFSGKLDHVSQIRHQAFTGHELFEFCQFIVSKQTPVQNYPIQKTHFMTLAKLQVS